MMHRSWIGACSLTAVIAASIGACDDAEPSATGGSDAGAGSETSSQGDSGGSPSEGGSADASDATSANLGAGPFTIAYAGTAAGIDLRPLASGKATLDGAKLTAYSASDDERPELGTNSVMNATGDAFVAIGRWAGGTTAGKFYDVNGNGLLTFAESGGLHYAIASFSDPIPSTGAATYTLSASTPVTVSDGSIAPGTLTGTLAANLAGATSKIGFALTLDVPGDASYTVGTTGGSSDVSTSESMILAGGTVKGAFSASVTVTSTGGACTGGGTCNGVVDGIVAGPNAERIAFVVHVFNGSGGSAKSVSAAAIFSK